MIFDDLELTEDLYYVEVFDKSNKNKDFMSVIDIEEERFPVFSGVRYC